ncbi:hypothetical protein [Massilia sp. Mn16-1_5]|uniref:hypothetical protein n=1 Tax=Massilia sp. Mn16-1_5 TaxID=2079199 RepID=UPI00109EE291|nr:hypothetical protein [Massilia sp. Mn16-1_5]
MRIRIVFYVLLALACSNSAFAKSLKITVGGKSLLVEAPAGYSDASLVGPDACALIKAQVSPEHRFLGLFYEDAEIEEIRSGASAAPRRYFTVLTETRHESKDFSPDDPRIGNEAVKKAYLGLIARDGARMKVLLGELAARTGRTAKGDPNISMNIGDAVVGEMLNVAPNAIGMLVVSKPSRIVEGKNVVFPIVSVVTRVYLKRKLVYLNVYSRLETKADMEWVKSASQQWVAATNKIN